MSRRPLKLKENDQIVIGYSLLNVVLQIVQIGSMKVSGAFIRFSFLNMNIVLIKKKPADTCLGILESKSFQLKSI